MPRLKKGRLPVPRPPKKRFARYGTTGSTGAVAELIVVVDLMKRGYEVFRAVSSHCSCDLIALKRGESLRIEVKSGYIDSNGGIRYGGKCADGSRYDIMALVVLATDAVRYVPQYGRTIPNLKPLSLP